MALLVLERLFGMDKTVLFLFQFFGTVYFRPKKSKVFRNKEICQNLSLKSLSPYFWDKFEIYYKKKYILWS